MLIAKILKKMMLPGLTFGEHCGNLNSRNTRLNTLAAFIGRQIDTMFMRNAQAPKKGPFSQEQLAED
jgi:hypothetical protein